MRDVDGIIGVGNRVYSKRRSHPRSSGLSLERSKAVFLSVRGDAASEPNKIRFWGIPGEELFQDGQVKCRPYYGNCDLTVFSQMNNNPWFTEAEIASPLGWPTQLHGHWVLAEIATLESERASVILAGRIVKARLAGFRETRRARPPCGRTRWCSRARMTSAN